jgi:hypothetical protein
MRITTPKFSTRSPLRKLVIPALALTGAFAFTSTASADNISVSKAQSKCRTYAQGVLDDDSTPFTKAHVKSVPVFPGHNHYVRCTVSYDSPQTESTKYYACIETLDVYLLPHNADRTRTLFMAHTSRPCGPNRLTGPHPA